MPKKATESAQNGAQKDTQKRSRIWGTILYPSSVPENFRELIVESRIACYLSPLHDQDVNEADGEKKPPHYHLLAKYDTMKSREQFQEFSKKIGGVGAELLHSFRGNARYLCHLDNPEKARYNVADVLSFNGIGDYVRTIMDSEEIECEIDQVVRDMLIFCRENFPLIRNNFSRLVDYAMDNNPEWFRHLRRDCAYIVEKKLKSAEYDRKESLIREQQFIKTDGCIVDRVTGELRYIWKSDKEKADNSKKGDAE